MLSDLLVAWRFLIKRPTSTVLAVLTLGITVGLSAIAVGAIDEAFLRSSGAGRGRLVTLYDNRPSAPYYQTLSYPDYLQVRERWRGRVDLAAFVRVEATLAGGPWPARVWGELVSGSYFSVLQARPFAGRLLTTDDDRISVEPVIVIGYDFWRRQFGADRAVVGTRLRLAGETFTVVGVTSPGFHGPAWQSEYWIPLARARQVIGVEVLSRSDAPILQTVGRQQAEETVEQIQSSVAGLATHSAKEGWRLRVLPAQYLKFWPAYRRSLALFLGLFAGLSACILLIAAANMAGLLLARADERQRELALRQALGATRLHLLRRLAAESAILAGAGAAVAMLVASWAAGLTTQLPVPVPIRLDVSFDLRLAIVCLALAFGAALLVTAVSAWKTWTSLRTGARSVLAASAATLAPRTGAHRLLAIVQVALSCVLMTIGGLLARTAWQIEQIDVGFSVLNGVLGRVSLDEQDPSAAGAFYEQLQERLARRPEVEAVAIGWHAPVSRVRATARLTLPGRPDALDARYNVTSAGYFKTLGIPLRAGRDFEVGDRRGAEPVAIINEPLAGLLKGEAVGQLLRLSGEPTPRRIVGIVSEIKYNGLTEPSQPFLYVPVSQTFRREMYVHVRTRLVGAERLLRTELQQLDPDVALSEVRTFSQQLDDARTTPRAAAYVSAGAAFIAVFLALVGLYGVLMTSVEQRQRELAIRAALGATPGQIVVRVVKEGFVLTIAGLALGMLVSLQAGALVANLLFGVAPRDPIVVTIVPLLVLLVSAAAWFAPARRAAAVDPIVALRSQ